MSPLLIISNIGFGVSAIGAVGLCFFIFLNNPRSTANITLTLAVLSVAIFIISHIAGINVTDPLLSRNILMFNLCNFTIVTFNVHAVLAFLGIDRERKLVLGAFYASTAFMITWFVIHPDLFLLPSVPKLYYPNYYNAGLLNWVRMAYGFGIAVPYMVYELAMGYRRTKDTTIRNQRKFFLVAVVLGYLFGFIPNLLVYNIPVDPLFGMLFVLFFGFPFAYGAIKYGLFDIKVIAKQASLYGIIVAVVGALIAGFNFSSQWIEHAYPQFPFWVVPLASAFLIVAIGVFVWKRLRETDLLKYEFITTATHKFRTPLTHIKWAAENLAKEPLSESAKEEIGFIEDSNSKLVELTNILVSVSEMEGSSYDYTMVRQDISQLANEIVSAGTIKNPPKHILVSSSLAPDLYAMCDVGRIRFVMQTLLENAIRYTPEGGTVSISTSRHGKNVVCSVRDSGIGIERSDMPHIFSKFYRGKKARETDTEGMGIGLYISREIINRHGGRIWVESEGAGKGSTFNFSLKAD